MFCFSAAVCVVVSHVPIDLSQYALKIVENAAPLLSSPNQDTRQDAQRLVAALSRQCSDAAAIEKLLSLITTTLKSKL